MCAFLCAKLFTNSTVINIGLSLFEASIANSTCFCLTKWFSTLLDDVRLLYKSCSHYFRLSLVFLLADSLISCQFLGMMGLFWEVGMCWGYDFGKVGWILNLHWWEWSLQPSCTTQICLSSSSKRLVFYSSNVAFTLNCIRFRIMDHTVILCMLQSQVLYLSRLVPILS